MAGLTYGDIGACPCTCQVTFIAFCGASTISGATVTVKSGGTTIDSGTTDGSGHVTLTIPSGGSYEVIATEMGDYGFDETMALSCGATYSLDLCCKVTVCVSTLAGAPISGATVTVKSGGTTVATCTTDASGCCTLDVGTPASYEVVVAATGYVTSDEPSVALACEGTHSVTLCTTANCLTFQVNGCGVAQPGATVTFAGLTGTTDSSGRVCIPTPAAGTYAYSVSQTRFAAATGSRTVTACGSSTLTVNLTEAAGYHCACNSASAYLPRPDTLFATDACLGVSPTLVYGADGGAYWSGSQGVTNSGCQCGDNNSTQQNITTVWYYWPDPGTGDCGGGVGLCPVQLKLVPPGQTGDNFCQSNCAGPTTFGGPASYTIAPGTALSVSASYTGCLPCVNYGVFGSLQGSCGGANIPVWQCTTVPITITE
jgi:carboxypeptidase family protein